jgi:hypothetical protein
MDESINKSDIKELRKKELRYKRWYLNVYEPIQKEIYRNVNNGSADHARHVRNLRYLEFLHQNNKRGAVFQDDYEPDEYNPIDLVNINANITKKLKDPTQLKLRKDFDEQNLIYKCIYGKDFSPKEIETTKLPTIWHDNESRRDIDWNKWMLIHHSTIGSTSRMKSS